MDKLSLNFSKYMSYFNFSLAKYYIYTQTHTLEIIMTIKFQKVIN